MGALWQHCKSLVEFPNTPNGGAAVAGHFAFNKRSIEQLSISIR